MNHPFDERFETEEAVPSDIDRSGMPVRMLRSDSRRLYEALLEAARTMPPENELPKDDDFILTPIFEEPEDTRGSITLFEGTPETIAKMPLKTEPPDLSQMMKIPLGDLPKACFDKVKARLEEIGEDILEFTAYHKKDGGFHLRKHAAPTTMETETAT